MKESRRLARVHRLKALSQNTRKMAIIMFSCGLVFIVPLVLVVLMGDLERMIGWLFFLALPSAFFCMVGGIMWRFGVKEPEEQILNREL